MSIRYSGDSEVRLQYDRKVRLYVGKVTDAFHRAGGPHRGEPYSGHVDVAVVARKMGGRFSPTSSEAYDHAAVFLLRQAQEWARRTGERPFRLDVQDGRIRVRRVFQAPCPINVG